MSAPARREGPRARSAAPTPAPPGSRRGSSGWAVLEAGQIAVRLLVGLVPKHLHFRDPPFIAIAGYAAAALAFTGLRWLLRRGANVAKALASVAIVASLLGTYVALNTATISPGPSTSPVLTAISESWRGVGWPGTLTHLEDFVTRPSGRWHVADLVASAFALLVGLTAIWFLATGTVTAPTVRPAPPSRAERALGFVLAVHLSTHAFLTIATLVGLSWRIAGSTA